MGQFVNAKFLALDDDGAPLAGGKLYTYEAGTSTPKTTYSDYDYTTPNANPIILDSRGEALIFGTGLYKFVLQDSGGNAVWTVDNVSPNGALADFNDQGLMINETINTKSTIGLTINQGTNYDNIISLKGSDIAHGVTDLEETDTFCSIKKYIYTAGGVRFWGFSTIDVAISLMGVATTPQSTDPPTTATSGVITLSACKKDGTGTQDLGATENLLSVNAGYSGTAEFVIKGDGELYSNQSATVGTFDDYEDAVMCGDLAYVLAEQYGNIVKHSKDFFEKMKIVGPDGMVSLTKMQQLQLCAIAELGRVLGAVCGKLGLDYNEVKKIK